MEMILVKVGFTLLCVPGVKGFIRRQQQRTAP